MADTHSALKRREHNVRTESRNIKNVQGERREPPRTSWILISEKTVGAKNLAMGVNKTHPGGMVPEHKHEMKKKSCIFCLGKGKFITEEEEIELEPGVCVYNRREASTKLSIPAMWILSYLDLCAATAQSS